MISLLSVKTLALALLALLRLAQQLAVALEQVGLGVERPAEEGGEADDVAAEPQRRKRLDPLQEPPRRVEREARGAVQRKLLVDRVGRSVEALVRGDDATDEEDDGEVDQGSGEESWLARQLRLARVS